MGLYLKKPTSSYSSTTYLLFYAITILSSCSGDLEPVEANNPYRWDIEIPFLFDNPIYYDGVYYGFPLESSDEFGNRFFIGIEELTGDLLFYNRCDSTTCKWYNPQIVKINDEGLILFERSKISTYDLKSGLPLSTHPLPESIQLLSENDGIITASSFNEKKFYEILRNGDSYSSNLIYEAPSDPESKFYYSLPPVAHHESWLIPCFELDFDGFANYVMIKVSNDTTTFHTLGKFQGRIKNMIGYNDTHMFLLTPTTVVALNKTTFKKDWVIFHKSAAFKVLRNKAYILSLDDLGLLVVDLNNGTSKKINAKSTNADFQVRDEFLFTIINGDLKVLDTKKDKWLITPESLNPLWAWRTTFSVGDHSVLLIDNDGLHCKPYKL